MSKATFRPLVTFASTPMCPLSYTRSSRWHRSWSKPMGDLIKQLIRATGCDVARRYPLIHHRLRPHTKPLDTEKPLLIMNADSSRASMSRNIGPLSLCIRRVRLNRAESCAPFGSKDSKGLCAFWTTHSQRDPQPHAFASGTEHKDWQVTLRAVRTVFRSARKSLGSSAGGASP